MNGAAVNIPTPSVPQPISSSRFEDFTVVTVSPLSVIRDGESAALLFEPDTLIDTASLSAGDRVRGEWAQGRLIVHGRAGGTEGGLTTSTVTLPASLAADSGVGAGTTGTVSLGVTGSVFGLVSSAAIAGVRLRLYGTSAARSADQDRVFGVPMPAACFLDVMLEAGDTTWQALVPAPYANLDTPAASALYYLLNNASGSAITGSPTVSLTHAI